MSRVSCFVNNSEFALACAARQAKAVAWAALLSPAGTSPAGVDGVFVPSNGVITLNLNRFPSEKKTEALQYQEATIRQNRVSGFVMKGRGLGGIVVSTRRAPDGRGWVFVSSNGVITLNLIRLPAEKKTEGLQYQQAPNEPRERPCFEKKP